MAQELELRVNGQGRKVSVSEPATLADVLAALELKPDRIAVELNDRIVRRTDWAAASVKSHDRLEIVHFVGGGTEATAR